MPAKAHGFDLSIYEFFLSVLELIIFKSKTSQMSSKDVQRHKGSKKCSGVRSLRHEDKPTQSGSSLSSHIALIEFLDVRDWHD
jgi:hypothetical protein